MRKRMAKMMAMAAAVVTIAAMVGGAPAYAATTESAQSNLSLYVANDPSYTITVPETVEIGSTEVTNVPITASDVEYIPEGKKISVTFEKGNGKFGRLYLEGTSDSGTSYTMTLKIKGSDDTEYKSGALEKQITGMELASFTEDGTEEFQIYPVSFDYPTSTNANLIIQKGVQYTGYIVYGVELVDIEE